jgi:hypothetical protein
MNKFLKLVTLIVVALLTAQSCDKNEDSFPLPVQKEVNAKVNGSNWGGEGSYFIAFGNNPQLFSITCKNDSSQLAIELRATGPGTYTVLEDGYYFSFPEKTIYYIKSGKVIIDEVTDKNLATGSFEFEAEDEEGTKKVKVTDGKFAKVKGLGYW